MPNTLAQALAFAQAEHDHRSQDWLGFCQKFARSAWNVGAYYGDASSAWFGAVYRHGPDVEPPPGALIFWTGGAAGHGHVAVSTGGWNCWSTDILRSGQVDHVKVALIDAAWPNVHRVGWCEDINRVRVINADQHQGEGGGTPIDPPGQPDPPAPPLGAQVKTYINVLGHPAKYVLTGADLIHIRPEANMTGSQMVAIWKRAAGAGLTEIEINRTEMAGLIANLRQAGAGHASCTCAQTCQMTGG